MRNAENGRRVEVDQTLVNKVVELFCAIGSTSWQSFVAHRLSLRKLPDEVQNALQEGWLDYTKAIEISRLSDKKLDNAQLAYQHRVELLNRVKNENLSIREIKNFVQTLINSHTNKQNNSNQIKVRASNLFSNLKKNYSTLTNNEQEKLNQLLGEMEGILNNKAKSVSN